MTVRESYDRLDSLSLMKIENAGAFDGPWFKTPATVGFWTPEFDALWSGEGSGILAMLDVQIAATEKAIERLPLDKGGRSTAPAMRSAKYCLVASCVAIAHFWNSDVIDTVHHRSPAGDFRDFVSYVYNIATGFEEVDLESDVKKCVRKYRRVIKSSNDDNDMISTPIKLKVNLEIRDFVPGWSIVASAAQALSPDADDGDQITDRT